MKSGKLEFESLEFPGKWLDLPSRQIGLMATAQRLLNTNQLTRMHPKQTKSKRVIASKTQLIVPA